MLGDILFTIVVGYFVDLFIFIYLVIYMIFG